MNQTALPYAEEVNYWQTSQTSPDVWMERTCKLISELGGTIMAEGFGREPNTGRAAYMLAFKIGSDEFRIVWPVLPTQTQKGERAARIQAATFLFHDTKAKVLKSFIFGARAAFFEYLMLPDGTTAAEATSEALMKAMPELFGGVELQRRQPALGSGDVEGEYKELK